MILARRNVFSDGGDYFLLINTHHIGNQNYTSIPITLIYNCYSKKHKRKHNAVLYIRDASEYNFCKYTIRFNRHDIVSIALFRHLPSLLVNQLLPRTSQSSTMAKFRSNSFEQFLSFRLGMKNHN